MKKFVEFGGGGLSVGGTPARKQAIDFERSDEIAETALNGAEQCPLSVAAAAVDEKSLLFLNRARETVTEESLQRATGIVIRDDLLDEGSENGTRGVGVEVDGSGDRPELFAVMRIEPAVGQVDDAIIAREQPGVIVDVVIGYAEGSERVKHFDDVVDGFRGLKLQSDFFIDTMSGIVQSA